MHITVIMILCYPRWITTGSGGDGGDDITGDPVGDDSILVTLGIGNIKYCGL